MKIVLSLATAALLAVSAAAMPCDVNSALGFNKVLAATALDSFFNKLDQSAVDLLAGVTYKQHDPTVPDGKEGLKTFIGTLPSSLKVESGAQAADENLVWTHSRYSGMPGMTDSIIVDIFRVQEGKVVEHWDIVQSEVLATQSAAGLPMFPIVANSTATACVSKETLAANKVLAKMALDAFFNKREASAVDLLVRANYKQHDPVVPAGPEGLKAFINSLPASLKVEFGAQAADEDLVWTHSRYSGFPGMTDSVVVDIFRVEDGKLVEHWDVIQSEVTADKTASGNAMFPIAL